MVAAIIKTVETRVLASYVIDTTNATVNYDRWLYVETYLVIITASIPCIRSFLSPMKGQTYTSKDTHELGSPYVISSSVYTRKTKKRELSLDRKQILNASGGNLSSEDICHSDNHDDIHDSGVRANLP
jgi:hypothetical protein